MTSVPEEKNVQSADLGTVTLTIGENEPVELFIPNTGLGGYATWFDVLLHNTRPLSSNISYLTISSGNYGNRVQKIGDLEGVLGVEFNGQVHSMEGRIPRIRAMQGDRIKFYRLKT
ncbi:MAG TPA: hypothetical protein VG965_03190 [Patescibacteria group bacterium]|nr:hypothetical protein [Patescibacteria group bacterium]